MTLSLKLSPVEGRSYKTTDNEASIHFAITTDNEDKIGDRIDILGAILTQVSDKNNYFGFSRNITGSPITTITITSKHPYRGEFNILEHDEDLSNYTEGTYECEVKIKIYIDNDGKMKPLILKSEMTLIVEK